MCPEFSFVIPVYNTAEYLDEALGSIVGQTIGFEEHAEVILLDDGSEDESLRCCYEWARRHPGRIKVLSRNHQGVCAARNTGFAASKGTWINFMDSDDA